MNVATDVEESPFMLNFNNNSSSNEGDTAKDKSVTPECDESTNKMTDTSSKKDVLTRLDSLVTGNGNTCDERDDTTQSVSDIFAKISRDKRKNEKPANPAGILKKPDPETGEPEKKVKRRIRFPDHEEMHEVIGYGGDVDYSSDEDEDDRSFASRRSRFADFGDKDDEMTVEEKNVLNLTRKNTTFNSHAPNLSVEGPPGPVQPQVRLGCSDTKKGPAPFSTVRPFVREHTPGKVTMVSPMRNGEVVTSFSADSTTTTTTAERVEEENVEALLTTSINNKSEGEGGGGVVAINKTKKTSASVILSREADNNSSEESGLNSDQTDASSSSEEGEMNLMNGGSSSPLFSDTLSDGNESTSLDDVLRSSSQQQKQDDDDLLLSGNNFERETTASLSSVSDDGEASNEGSSTSTSGDEDIKCEKDKSVDEEEVHHQHGRDYFHATARLSFLHSTIQFEEQSCNKEEQQHNNSTRQQNNNYNNSEESSEYSSSNDSSTRPKVKITRKSPYVVGPYASTAILKGTPKPSVNIRKPPLPKEKPKVPLKPEKFLHNNGNSKVSPIAAPRKSSFRSSSQPPPMPSSSEYANVANEVRISDESRIQLCLSSLPHDQNLQQGALPAYECYSANSDVQNALIIDVSASGPVEHHDSNVVTISSSSFHTDTVSTTTSTALSQNQKDSATKNREALEAIRKSLSDKLAEVVIVDSKQVENKNEEKNETEEKDNGQNLSIVSAAPVKRSVEKTVSNTSSNFELNRATIANALEFNRHDRVARPSTKRQAPKPPPNSLSESGTESLSSAEPEQKSEQIVVDVVQVDEAPTKDLPPEPIPIPPPPPPPPAPSMPKSALSTTSAGRHSSMKSSDASSPKSREVKNRVQFSPETMTVTLPPTEERNLQPISYNRWMGRPPGDVIESSFTGQPINVPRPPHVPVVVASGSAPLSHPKRPVPVTYAPMPQVDDEVRRWTEKKHKQRSKSLPRGSEIDEIIGSSKLTKAGSKLFSPSVLSSASVTSSNPVRRQSRVELYETERKQLQQQLQQQQRKGKFSLKKFFKIGLNHNPYGIQFPPGEGSKSPVPAQPSSTSSSPAHTFLDKEHEREILERERSRLRPEIIHPIDLQSAGVEVVCITPRGGQQHFEKNQRTSNGVNKAGPCKTLTSNKGKVDYVDSKDSGHETSSIHTENSEGSASSTASSAVGSSEQTPSPTLQKSFLQKEEPEDHGELPADRLRNKGNGGRSKPVPPPRSHSLETFGKKFDLEDHDQDQDEDDDDQAETDLELPRVNIVAETEVGKNQGYDKFGPQTSSSLAPCVRGLERYDTDKPLTSLSSESSSSADGLPPHQAYIQPGKMKIGNMTSVPAINTIQHSSFGSPQHSSPNKFGGLASRNGSLNSSSGGHSDSFSFPRGMMVYPVMTEEEVVTGNGYYGSEGDSERESISPPRINHHDEAVDEDEPVRNGPGSKSGGREGSRGHGLSRLSIRKGRSVVHKNLEDNYGAVISANHEALAQILEQASQRRPCVGKTMRPLSNITDLKLDQFTQVGSLPTAGHEMSRVETKAGTFVSAIHTASKTPVTLMLNADRSFTKKNQNSFSLFPASSFEDVADLNTIFGAKNSVDSELNKKVFVSVFPRMQVETLSSYSAHLATSTKLNSQSWEKEVSFILLQLINALKFLQAQGIEEITPDLNHFVLSREDRDPHYRVVIVDNVTGDENDGVTRMSLSCTALAAMLLLFHCDDPVGQAQRWVTSSESDASASRPTLPELTPSVGMFRTMADLLQRGSSIALNQVKSMLEYMLWGPSDITMSQSREQGLQRWLDLERATVLNNLIRTQGLWNIELTIFEEYHLLFLVQTCAKMLLEASLLFESEVACM